MIDLSITIPAYNEEYRIVATIREIHTYLKERPFTYEILVVDDGSTDATVSIVSNLMDTISPLNLIQLAENKGKGKAVKTGMLNANGAIRVFTDADGSTPISELEKLIRPIKSGQAQLAIGTRYHSESEVNKPQPLYRRIWSRMANRIVQHTLLPGIADPNCGFKAFKDHAAIRLFSGSTVKEWSFDLEILALAVQHNYVLAEIPVKWDNDERSKGKIRHVPKEIYNVYRIKRRTKQKVRFQTNKTQ